MIPPWPGYNIIRVEDGHYIVGQRYTAYLGMYLYRRRFDGFTPSLTAITLKIVY